MTKDKKLIIIKGEDKTADISNIKYSSGRVQVTFNNSVKPYFYAASDVCELTLTSTIPATNVIVEIDGSTLYNVHVILKYGKWYKIIYEHGKTEIIEEERISIKDKPIIANTKSKDMFEYFRQIAEVVSVRTEDGTALLEKEYKKINYVDKATALYAYIKDENKKINIFSNNCYIFPFGSNKSQYEAVKQAMENKVSVIEGPPGTGKTQTILNIIANIIKNGQTVAVVSNNNAATDNVYEMLEKNGLGYLCAPLGKRKNKESFISSQTGEYPKLEKVNIDEYKLKSEIINLNYDLKEVFTLQNEVAKAKVERSDIILEHKYYIQYEGWNNEIKIRGRNIESILKLKYDLERLKQYNEQPPLWFKINYVFFKHTGSFKLFKQPIGEIIKACDRVFFETKEEELKNKILTKTERIKKLNGDKLLEELKRKSLQMLNHILFKKYGNKESRKKFEVRELTARSEAFLMEYPIVFSTTHSIKRCLSSDVKYDYIIMDEASQVDLITGALALSCAKNAVIVGDRKQLQNVVSTESKKQIEKIALKFDIPYNFDYVTNSFLNSVINSIHNLPYTLLKEHYRCHPKIIGFCNKKFYNNELVIMTQDQGEKDVLKVYLTPEGNHARGKYNQREIDIIEKEVLAEFNGKIDEDEIGTIAPFRDQKAALNDTFQDTDIQSDTIHKFQGREKEAIIITTVQNKITDFVDDPQMLNVAVTRAKSYLRIVTNSKAEESNTNLSDLIKYVKYNNFEVKESKVKSIYDFLYRANRKEKMKFLKDKKLISEYDSENITYNLIQNIIKDNGYELDVASHVKLSHIIKNMNELTEEEKKFANHEWTHIDFVIYNKMDRLPVLCVEVDGYYNHIKIKQKNRDELKNSILSKCGIKIIRLSTVGSGEEEKIIEALNELE